MGLVVLVGGDISQMRCQCGGRVLRGSCLFNHSMRNVYVFCFPLRWATFLRSQDFHLERKLPKLCIWKKLLGEDPLRRPKG